MKQSKKHDLKSRSFSSSKRQRTTHSPRPSSSSSAAKPDPSLPFLQNPLACPIVAQAKKYFLDHLSSSGQKPPKPSFSVSCGPVAGWRTSAKLAVRGNPPVIGMFEEGSHRIVECLSSPSHAPELNRALLLLAPLLPALSISGYDEQSGSGDLRYVALRSTPAQTVELALVWNTFASNSAATDSNSPSDASIPTQVEALVAALTASERPPLTLSPEARKARSACVEARGMWHSIWLHYHDGDRHNNAIFSYKPDTWQLLWGERFIAQQLSTVQEISSKLESSASSSTTSSSSLSSSKNNNSKLESPTLPATLYFLPSVFRQANPAGFAHIVRAIRAHLMPHPRRVVELYGGVGTIGLNLVDLVQGELVCSDENPYNLECFERARLSLPSPHAAKCRYAPLGASKMVAQGHVFDEPLDVLVVDPPRKGLDAEVVTGLAKQCPFFGRKGEGCRMGARCRFSHFPGRHRPRQLVYVSCGFKALQRDMAALLEQGWEVAHCEGFLLFPGADHIETLVILESPQRSTNPTLWGR